MCPIFITCKICFANALSVQSCTLNLDQKRTFEQLKSGPKLYLSEIYDHASNRMFKCVLLVQIRSKTVCIVKTYSSFLWLLIVSCFKWTKSKRPEGLKVHGHLSNLAVLESGFWLNRLQFYMQPLCNFFSVRKWILIKPFEKADLNDI